MPKPDGKITRLHEKWLHADFKSIKRFCAYETQPENGFKVVDKDSATRGCEDTLAIPANHREMVKPCNTRSDAYLALENKLRTVSLSTDVTTTQPVVISAPNGIAIGGGAVENPTVNNLYNMPRPLPEMTLTVTEGTRRMVHVYPAYLEMRVPIEQRTKLQNPHKIIEITVDRNFMNPAFMITCDHPCGIAPSSSIGGASNEMPTIKGGNSAYQLIPLANDNPNTFGFKLQNFTLMPKATLVVDVGSSDLSDIDIKSVEPAWIP